MKMTSALVEQTLNQFEAHVIPDSHPAVPQLKGVFGDHTFFLSSGGLDIVEPVDAPGADPSGDGVQTGTVIELASWTDSNSTALAPHDPEPVGTVVLQFEH
jgi:hypothetical protein